MTESEAVAPVEVAEDAEKENIEPVATTEDAKESAVSVDPETNAESKKDAKADATDPPALDLSIYTEDKLYDDIHELIRSEGLDVTTSSKKVFRRALSEKYGLGPKGKMFKKHEPFENAIVRIAADFTAKQEEDAESEKKKKSKKKTRKRKRPSSDDEDGGGDDGAPTKKRKTNDGGAVVDGDGDANDDDDEDDGDGSGSKKKSKKKEATKRKKKAKLPYENSLQKLKKLARAVGLANPKMYGKLKAMPSNKKQVDFLKELLTEKEVPITNLSEAAIKKIQADYALKREMAELGIGAGGGDALETEDGVPLSCRRPKRTRSKVNYKPPKYEKESGGNNDGSDEEEYVEDEEDDEESEEEYEPSDCDEEE